MSEESAFKIEISEPMLKSEIPAYLESSGFNAACDEYTLHYWNEFTKDLTPEHLYEVREWWGPGWPAHFQRGRLRADFYETRSKAAERAIAMLISYGLG
jgi:hypothetical protein